MNDANSVGASRAGTPIARRLLSRLLLRFTPRRLECREMVELVTAYLEEALDDVSRARFEHHLRGCDGCAEYLEQLRVTVHAVGAIREEEIDPVFRSRLLEAFAETAGSW